MALAKQLNTFASAHPAVNFFGGLMMGIGVAVGAAVLILSPQSDDSVEARSFAPTVTGEELAAPRILVGDAGSTWGRSEEEALAAERIAGPRTHNSARVGSEEEALAAPRVVVAPALVPLEVLQRTSSSDEDAMAAERVLVR